MNWDRPLGPTSADWQLAGKHWLTVFGGSVGGSGSGSGFEGGGGIGRDGAEWRE